jgi:hypothetical protein
MKIDLAMSMKPQVMARRRTIDLAILMKVRDLLDNPGNESGWASDIVGKRRLPRQSRGLYHSWPLKGAGTSKRPLTPTTSRTWGPPPRTSATLSPGRGMWF